jgi:hypothetical protein
LRARKAPGDWSDVTGILQQAGHRVDAAWWDKRSGGLVVKAAASEGTALDRLWPPFLKARDRNIVIDAMLFSTDQPLAKPEPAELRVETITALAQQGKLTQLGAVTLQVDSGMEVRAKIMGTTPDESFEFTATPVLDLDGYEMEIAYRLAATIQPRTALEQSGSVLTCADQPTVFTLGGAGTQERPLFILVLWARGE